MSNTTKKGFTLLEVLLVVAAIAILAGIAIFAINPGKQLAELRNGKRQADVSLIVNATSQYLIDGGLSPSSFLPVTDDPICAAHSDAEIALCTTSGCGMNLSMLTDNQKYLVAMPVDPSGGVQNSGYAGYFMWVNSNNRITVCAPKAELGATISVTK